MQSTKRKEFPIMKKIIGIAAAALLSLSLFACGTTTTKTTRYIEDVPYSTTRTVRHTNNGTTTRTNKIKAPRVLTPKNVRTHRAVDAPNLLPYVTMYNSAAGNSGNATLALHNPAGIASYNVNN